MLPAQQLHSSVIHKVSEALPDSIHFPLNALVQLEGQHMLVVLLPVGASHLYLTPLWHKICFLRHAIATAEGQA